MSLINFHKTEKASILEKEGKYVFEILSKINKIQIRKEVERLYKVKVKAVNIISQPSKKAIITLEKGYKINEKV